MKTSSIVIVSVFLTVLGTQAQAAGAPTIANPSIVQAPNDYRVVQRDANSQVWQRTEYTAGPNGQVMTNFHKYVELASGLNHFEKGQWIRSKEEIVILPDGGAAATNGQHQAYFPSDIYSGVIRLVTPEGYVLQSRPVGMSYDDGTNTVMIAELTNSVGYLAGSNQVIYPDAFTGFKADLCYTYTKAGFEQDVILRQQPPTPESLELNADTAKLQLLTEFFSPPKPAIKSRTLPVQAGLSLPDQSLCFGKTEMIQGRAFLLGQKAKDTGAWVGKQFMELDGRKFLVEEVPVNAVADGLAALPLTAVNSSPSRTAHMASRKLALPAQRLAKNVGTKTVMRAKAGLPERGFVLDYQTINGYLDYFTFQGDTTYYMSGNISASQVTIEGGAVIKAASDNGLNDYNIYINYGSLLCKASTYRPAIFTAIDDNSVGETISGSTGTPSGYYGVAIFMYEGTASLISNLRFCYANTGLRFFATTGTGPGSSVVIRDCQFLNCGYSIYIGDDGNTVCEGGNLLFNNDQVAFYANYVNTYATATHITAHGVNYLTAIGYGGGSLNLFVTNSLLIGVTNLGGGSVTGAYNYTSSSDAGIFQTVGGGAHYLATNCPAGIRSAGTTNVDSALLAELQNKTTYPPVVYALATISTNLVLYPQAARDTNAAPDLGYHYDPLDYVFGGCDLFTNLILNAGTAVGWYEDYGNEATYGQPYGISVNDGAAMNWNGIETASCWFARFNTVQESRNGNWQQRGWMSGIMINGSSDTSMAQVNANFTKWSEPQSFGGYCRDDWAYGSVNFVNCEFYNGGVSSYWGPESFTNCLFIRTGINAYNNYMPDNPSATFQNCTFYNGGICLQRSIDSTPSVWNIQNTTFDGTSFLISDDFNANTNYTSWGWNAYNAANTNWTIYNFGFGPAPTNIFEPLAATDVVVPAGFNWQTSWLGNFYLPPNSSLINAGSSSAGLVGLYYYTTQASQMIESNSIVDIGYHYVAVSTNGLPFTDNNGIALYLGGGLDPDGSGLPIWWEMTYFGQTGVNPAADPTGDGLSNLQSYQAGVNPNVDQSTVPSSRINYIYDAGGWLRQVSGRHAGAVVPDNEGNVQAVSQ